MTAQVTAKEPIAGVSSTSQVDAGISKQAQKAYKVANSIFNSLEHALKFIVDEVKHCGTITNDKERSLQLATETAKTNIDKLKKKHTDILLFWLRKCAEAQSDEERARARRGYCKMRADIQNQLHATLNTVRAHIQDIYKHDKKLKKRWGACTGLAVGVSGVTAVVVGFLIAHAHPGCVFTLGATLACALLGAVALGVASVVLLAKGAHNFQKMREKLNTAISTVKNWLASIGEKIGAFFTSRSNAAEETQKLLSEAYDEILGNQVEEFFDSSEAARDMIEALTQFGY